MKPTVLTVDNAGAFLPGEAYIIRDTTAHKTMWAVPRRSGKLNTWPFSFAPSPRGKPFGGSLSEENQERLEAARFAVFGED